MKTPDHRSRLPRFSDRLKIGSSGLSVSPFCVGLVSSPAVVTAAFDCGVNFFFVTADMHWRLYEPLRQGLRRLLRGSRRIRDQIVVAAACYLTQPEFCLMSFEEVLQEIPELTRIDLLVAGGVYASDFKQRLPVYREHRKTRFVGARAIGATFHERKAAIAALNKNLVDVAFIRYNPEHPGARKDLFPKLKPGRRPLLFSFKSTKGFLPRTDLARLGVTPGVYWQPQATDYYRFALSRPETDGLLIAPETVPELRALQSALKKGPLDAEEEKYLLDLALVSAGRAYVVARR